MEKKKSENADLGKGRITAFLIGIIIGLATMYTCLEWTNKEGKDDENAYVVPDVSFDQEIIPITLPEKKVVPPPPQSVKLTDVFEIIDNDADVPDDIATTPEDQDLYIEINPTDVIEVGPEPDEDIPFVVVEDMPEFPGGTTALLEYLRKNIKYPAICRENNVQGRVLITFIVDKDGSIKDAEVVKVVNPYLDKEALRVINNMPKWTPGKQRGKAVRVKYTVPVNFRLN